MWEKVSEGTAMGDIVNGSGDPMADNAGSSGVEAGADDHAGVVLLTMLTVIVLLVCAVVLFGYTAIIVFALAATLSAFVALVWLTAGR
jgi:hypothetical protein